MDCDGKQLHTCFGGSCGPCLRSVRVLLSGRVRITVTGCLKMEAVCRIGKTRFTSCLIPNERKTFAGLNDMFQKATVDTKCLKSKF